MIFLQPIMKEEIENILIKGKKYRDPDYSAIRLAEDLGCSVFKISRAIKKDFGCSYSDLVLSRRIEDAKRHLTNPNKADYTVDDIGVLVGFKNRMSFFIAFKKYAGTTPEKWRKKKGGPTPGPSL